MFKLTARSTVNEWASHEQKLAESLFPIEFNITKELYEFGVTAYRNNYSTGLWTNGVKDVLRRLGHAEGFLTFPQFHDGTFSREWLFDFVWADAKRTPNGQDEFDWRHTRSLRLACECEWTPTESEVLTDFFKLAFVVADLRLFVYSNTMINSNGRSIHPVDLCKRASPLSRGYRYLAIGFSRPGDDEFRVDTWVA